MIQRPAQASRPLVVMMRDHPQKPIGLGERSLPCRDFGPGPLPDFSQGEGGVGQTALNAPEQFTGYCSRPPVLPEPGRG